MAKRWTKAAWTVIFPVVGWLARSRWHGLSLRFGRLLGDLTLRIRGGQHREDLEQVGQEWQRMFPSRRMVPISHQDETTVFAQIHANCPLRGTGDTAACHRMMEYDRRMLETIGGQLVVLRSQAEPGRTYCEVAIRKADAPVGDLIPAHERS